MNAAMANYPTLITSGCSAPAAGGTYCFVLEGGNIDFGVMFHLKKPGAAIIGGEISVFYKDAAPKNYAVTSDAVEVPFVDIFGEGKWNVKDHDTELLVLGKILYKDNAGVTRETPAIGHVRVFVASPKFAGALPIDSGFVAFQGRTSCVYQYTTSARSAVKCQ